jgi:hypothetical protein
VAGEKFGDLLERREGVVVPQGDRHVRGECAGGGDAVDADGAGGHDTAHAPGPRGADDVEERLQGFARGFDRVGVGHRPRQGDGEVHDPGDRILPADGEQSVEVGDVGLDDAAQPAYGKAESAFMTGIDPSAADQLRRTLRSPGRVGGHPCAPPGEVGPRGWPGYKTGR